MKISLFIKYFLFVYLLAVSSFEYFFRVSMESLYYLFPAVCIGFYYYRKKMDILALLIIAPFALSFVMRTLLFGTPFHYSVTLIIRLLTVYFSIKLIEEDFLEIFIQTIKYIAIISIIFYCMQYFGVTYNIMISIAKNFHNVGEPWTENLVERPNFIIYAIQTKEIYDFMFFRNSGPFYEPGLYAVFLNIVLFLNLFLKQKILNKTNILFVISIVSTFSTMGYIALLVNIFLYNMLNKSLSYPMRTLFVVFLIVLIPAVSALPFMSKKINKEYSETDISYSRFGAAVMHYNIVKDYPLTGMPASREVYSNYSDHISPNGITEIFLRYGIIAGFIYYILLYRMSSLVMKLFGFSGKGYVFFFILVLVIFGETMGNKPIYWAIIFAQIPLMNFINRWERIENLKISKALSFTTN